MSNGTGWITITSGASGTNSGTVAYTVTAIDGTTKTYTVTVDVASIASKDITRFEGVISWDVVPTRAGRIYEPHFRQLVALGKATRG